MTKCKKCETTDDNNFTSSYLKFKTAMCKKCRSDYTKNYRIENIEKLKLGRQEYYQKKKNSPEWLEERKEYLFKWKSGNKEHIRQYENDQYKTNDSRNIIKKMRARMHAALKYGRGIKKKKTIDYLGCNIDDFKLYLTSKFTKGMSWDLLMCGEIHIDHIRPCVSFNLKEEEDLEKCFHYTNMQPLWAVDNLKKGCKYEK